MMCSCWFCEVADKQQWLLHCVSRWGLGRPRRAAVEADSYESYETFRVAAHTMYQYMWFDRHTLMTNETSISAYDAAGGGYCSRRDEFVCLVLESRVGFNGLGLCGSRAFWQRPDDIQHHGASFTTGAGTGFAALPLADRLGDRGLSVKVSADGYYADVKAGVDVENENQWVQRPGLSGQPLGSGKTCRSAIEPIRRLRTMPARRSIFGFA